MARADLRVSKPAAYGAFMETHDVPAAFARRVIDAWRNRPRAYFSLVVSGGDLARRCYQRLAKDGHDTIDWSTVDIYWGDERLVPRRHPDSNEYLVRDLKKQNVTVRFRERPCDHLRVPMPLDDLETCLQSSVVKSV